MHSEKHNQRSRIQCHENCDILMAELDQMTNAYSPKTPNVDDTAPGLQEIGRAGWTVLHTFAAYYPDSPSLSDKFHALTFVGTFAALFPCGHCSAEFKEIIEDVCPVSAL
jgi:FAD-linked sulfhydryl oxidase